MLRVHLTCHIGSTNNILSTIGTKAHLAAVGRGFGIDALVIMNPGHCGPVSDGVVATAVEAIIGAIYLDCGKNMDVVRSFIATIDLTANAAT